MGVNHGVSVNPSVCVRTLSPSKPVFNQMSFNQRISSQFYVEFSMLFLRIPYAVSSMVKRNGKRKRENQNLQPKPTITNSNTRRAVLGIALRNKRCASRDRAELGPWRVGGLRWE